MTSLAQREVDAAPRGRGRGDAAGQAGLQDPAWHKQIRTTGRGQTVSTASGRPLDRVLCRTRSLSRS